MDSTDKYKSRSKILKQEGVVVWLTGLPGSGKSTLAGRLEDKLLEMNKLAYVLDGDAVRNGLNSDLGFSDADRNENIRRIAEVAAILKDASLITIVAFISPFIKMREFARTRAGDGNFIEVYIKASLETCIKRDPKGLYKKAISNQILQFTGITSAYEEPVNPDLVIDTDKLSVEDSAEILEKFVLKHLDKSKK
ncbi:MAG: adenylyl-sulfate kinase [Bacteroidales bacterium]|jgi:adenylylsulfate kinase|nr:adenylyl-sulfate kinase [Bacteroidales bacterium]